MSGLCCLSGVDGAPGAGRWVVDGPTKGGLNVEWLVGHYGPCIWRQRRIAHGGSVRDERELVVGAVVDHASQSFTRSTSLSFVFFP